MQNYLFIKIFSNSIVKLFRKCIHITNYVLTDLWISYYNFFLPPFLLSFLLSLDLFFLRPSPLSLPFFHYPYLSIPLSCTCPFLIFLCYFASLPLFSPSLVFTSIFPNCLFLMFPLLFLPLYYSLCLLVHNFRMRSLFQAISLQDIIHRIINCNNAL